jgi:hypothetical protein
MKEIAALSEAKQALLEKYLRGVVGSASATKTVGKLPETPPPASPEEARTPLVAVQTQGKKRPFFYLHVHWQGGAFYSFPLARVLGEDQPFYVLDPYKFEGLQQPPALEEMAQEYVRVMRTVQPEGPYLLGGFCGGCVIAFEIAQQLRNSGQEVALLVLIEPGVTGRMLPALEQFGPLYLKCMGHSVRRVGQLLRLGPVRSLHMFLSMRHLYRWLRYKGWVQGKGMVLCPSREVLHRDWMGIFVWIVSAYKPRPYPGRIVYFWTREEPPSRRAAWDKMRATAQETVCEMIVGTHDSCRNEDLPDMAEHLKGYLERVQAELVESAG